MRLESYLFTAQAMQAARERLRPAASSPCTTPTASPGWSTGYAATVAQAFGHKPCVDLVSYGGSNAVIVADVDAAARTAHHRRRRPLTRRSPPHRPGAGAGQRRPAVPLPADAVDPGSVPARRCWGSCWSACSPSASRAGRPARLRPYVDLAFLGAAFLLLETRGVTRFALLFGTTWLVNALVFAGVLVVRAARGRDHQTPAPASLPGDRVRPAGGVPRADRVRAHLRAAAAAGRRPALVAAVAVTFAPIVAANIVFAARFAGTADPTAAFGANLLGCDGRRLPGVPRPADRLPRAGRRRGRALPRGVPARAARAVAPADRSGRTAGAPASSAQQVGHLPLLAEHVLGQERQHVSYQTLRCCGLSTQWFSSGK